MRARVVFYVYHKGFGGSFNIRCLDCFPFSFLARYTATAVFKDLSPTPDSALFPQSESSVGGIVSEWWFGSLW